MQYFNTKTLREKLPLLKDVVSKISFATKSFFKSRFNQDNKWNLKWFAYTIAVLAATEYVIKLIYPETTFPISAIFIMLFEIFCVVIIAQKTNPVEYVFNGYDHNLEQYKAKLGNRIFKKENLNNIIIFLVFGIFTLLPLDFQMTFSGNKIPRSFFLTFCVAWTLMFPTLYCITKNLPLTMFLHKDAWKVTYETSQGTTSDNHKRSSSSTQAIYKPSSSTSSSYKISQSFISASSMRSNPINRNLPGNIFNHKR